MASLSIDSVEPETILSAIARVEKVRDALALYPNLKKRLLWMGPQIDGAMDRYVQVKKFALQASEEQLYILGLSISVGQFDHLFQGVDGLKKPQEAIAKLVSILVETERFYAPLGGLLGYYAMVLRLLLSDESLFAPSYSPPPCTDMRSVTQEVWHWVYEGIRRLPETAEVYTVGGAGDRLRLVDPLTKEPMPVAQLEFCSKPLLEWLFRDLQAKEYWYFRTFGQHCSVPVVLMTSAEKNNDFYIARMGEKFRWFGKANGSVRRIVQSLVPLISCDGKWVCSGPAELMAKPGGHGVIWKLAQDQGALHWLREQNVEALIIRQINNPLAGLDHALSSLLGTGLAQQKKFGFAGIERIPGLAEGLLVLKMKERQSQVECSISNIEYTKFASLSQEHPELLEDAICPANTNTLFANLRSIEEALYTLPIPGVVVNAKTCVDMVEGGVSTKRPAVRLESTMQNIADAIVDTHPRPYTGQPLSTFVNLYDRASFFSVTKKLFQPGQSALETPEKCFYDWYLACTKLLRDHCLFSIPDPMSLDDFLQNGPSSILFFHPALGPFWEVIAQKVSGGQLAEGSELELEIAEIYLRNLKLKGSLRILAEAPTGHLDEHGVRHFSNDVGRAFLTNITVENEGVQHTFASHMNRAHDRALGATIWLEGASEVVGDSIHIRGPFELSVPHGKRARLTQSEDGGILVNLEEYRGPSWMYDIQWEDGKPPILTPRF